MPITELPIYSPVFHPFRIEVEQRLISKGNKFGAHRGYHYRAYEGIGFDKYTEDYEPHVNSRVIIATAAFHQLHPRSDPQYNRDSKSLKLRQKRGEQRSLDGEHLRLCVPRFRAYSVNDKRWLNIMMDDVKDIEWDDQAFRNLALPQEQKEMILSFANS